MAIGENNVMVPFYRLLKKHHLFDQFKIYVAQVQKK